MSFKRAQWQPDWRKGENFFMEFPVTKVIVILMAAVFLGAIMSSVVPRTLLFDPYTWPNWLVGLVTYPLVPQNILSLLFGGFMVYMFGGSLERSWGSRTFLLFLLVTNAAAALIWFAGVFLLRVNWWPLGTPWIMITSLVVAWSLINQEETILLMFVLPMKAKWVGWLSIVLLYFSMPSMVGARGLAFFILGFFSLGGVALTWAYNWYRRQWGWIPRRRKEKTSRALRHPSSNPLGILMRPLREWQRRRRVAHLERTFTFSDDDPR